MASNEASQAHTHDSTRPAKAAAEGGTVCEKLRHSHRIQTMGSQTTTRTPKLILRVDTRAGKKEKLCWRKKKWIACFFIRDVFKRVFNFSLHTIDKILFQTHLLTCKRHPAGFSVITSTSTSTRKLILRVSKLGGRKTMVGDMRNKLHVSLFAMVLKNFSNSFAKQSIKFFSKRIFFLVNATQVDLASLIIQVWLSWHELFDERRNIAKLIRGGPTSHSQAFRLKLVWVPLT